MSIFDKFDSNYEYDPIVHNLAQPLENHARHHTGVLQGKTSPFGEENPRVEVSMLPKDAKSKTEAERTCRYSVREDRIKEFAPGTLGPRAHWYLMPDNVDQLPSRIKTDEHLGPFFQAWFKQQNLIKALRFKARHENEIMDKLRFASTPSELDDRVARVMNRHLDQIQERAQQMNSSGSDSS
jgi:hypothetical protein